MAELVHQNEEEMLQELEQMQNVGLFTSAEIKAIIRKRNAHEYKLVRKTKVKKDFLDYIQYEINLLALIHKRRKREHYFFKQDEIEYVIVSRIHRWFKQMMVRWADDLKVWTSHAAFCLKWNKKVQLSKLCTRMVQVHASNPKVWLLAAKWELECGDSMEKVRSLFLRGIKFHPKSEKMWLEYFRAELLFTEKRHRRFKMITKQDVNLNDEGSDSALMKGKAALIIYKNALQAFPDNVEMHLKFLDILSAFLATNTFAVSLFNEIKDDLSEIYNNSPKMRACLAKLHLKETLAGISFSGKHKEIEKHSRAMNCYQDFDKAVKEIDTPEMWSKYFNFALSMCQQSQPNQVSGPDSLFSLSSEQLMKVADHCHGNNILTCQQYIAWVDFLLKTGQLSSAYDVLCEVCGRRDEVELWLKRLKVAHLGNGENIDLNELFQLTCKFSNEMTKKQQEIFWSMWMQNCVVSDAEETAESVLTNKAVGCCCEAALALQHVYLKWMAVKYNVNHAYQMFMTKIKNTRTPTPEQYKDVLELLNLSPSVAQSTLQECYEHALHDHGETDPGLWLDYMKFLTQKENMKKCGHVYWRALKTLKPEFTDDFVSQHSMLKCSIKTRG
uniref:U3 small nucleolar RNA-associated protein 6 homolog n=1 Tax=Ciona intestinalis TaxID=7719 RepID=H2Y152_CIOIN